MMRLSGKEWIVTMAICLVCLGSVSRFWPRLEGLESASESRVPYDQSSDYWLFAQAYS